MDTEQLFKTIVQLNGREKQLRQLQEECAELIAAVNHYIRRQTAESETAVFEEAADVGICLAQLPHIFGDAREAVEEITRQKTKRLQERAEHGRNL